MRDTNYRAAFTFKKRESPKLKTPEYIFYDEKGAAFIVAPFSSRARELESHIPVIAAAPSLYAAAKLEIDRCPNCFDNNCTDAVHDSINAALALVSEQDSNTAKPEHA